MAIHGKASGIVMGRYELTRYLREISVSRSTDTADASHFGTDAKEYVAGQSDATVTMSGLYEGGDVLAVTNISTLLEDAQYQDGVVPFLVLYGALGKGGVGAPAQLGTVRTSSFDVSSPVGDVVSIAGSLQGDGGVKSGVVTVALAPVAVTTNGGTIDQTAATTLGGRAQLHLVQNSRNGTATVTLQHSTNGSTWVDLNVFPVVAAGTLSTVDVDLPGTINRYVRSIVTLAGSTGTVTYTVALARN